MDICRRLFKQFCTVGRLNFVQRNGFVQLLRSYRRLLFNERSLQGLVRAVKDRRSFGLLATAVFSFARDGIANDEIRRAMSVSNLVKNQATTSTQVSDQLAAPTGDSSPPSSADAEWELLLRQEDLSVYRRRVAGRVNFFEYKCEGTYRDISPLAFYQAQMDLEYRKRWDQQIISIDVLQKDEATGSEVIRWVMQFPYPMYPREYTFVRRSCIDPERKVLVITCKAVHHPSTRSTVKKCVRVRDYFSCMTIRYRSDIRENGLEYVLIYYDDPQTFFPDTSYYQIIRYGIPCFVNKVYEAAKRLVPPPGAVAEAMHDLRILNSCADDGGGARLLASDCEASADREPHKSSRGAVEE